MKIYKITEASEYLGASINTLKTLANNGKHYLFRDWTSPSQIIENYKHGFEQINQFKGGF